MMHTHCTPLRPTAPLMDAVARLTVRRASSAREVEQACRLRYQVFVEEPGVESLYNAAGIERDALDDVCDHLIVRDDTCDRVVATYRLLPGGRAAATRLYTESEFDLHDFRGQVAHTLELARSCVHKDYRHGPAARLLWDGMLRWFYSNPDFHYLIGCASVRTGCLEDISILHSYFLRQPCGQHPFGIRPRQELRIAGLRDMGAVDPSAAVPLLPTMVKAYLRLGGLIAPEPVYDPIFHTYDFCMIVPKSSMPQAYQRKYAAR